MRRRAVSHARSDDAEHLPIHGGDGGDAVDPRRRRRSGAAKNATAFVAFSIACALVYWIHHRSHNKLAAHDGTADATSAAAPAASSSPLRIGAAERANLTQWFPCVDDASGPPYADYLRPVLPPHRKTGRVPNYTSLPCAPPDDRYCFRGVYDGYDFLLDDARATKRVAMNKIGLLIESLIANPGGAGPAATPESLRSDDGDREPDLLAASVNRQKTYSGPDVTMKNYGQLHADYFESAGYVYTSILYDDPPDNLVGGETALVDFTSRVDPDGVGRRAFGMRLTGNASEAVAPDGGEEGGGGGGASRRRKKKVAGAQNNADKPPIEFSSGVVVEPRRGRLVVFTSGGENFHAPLEVLSGKRPTYHFWFVCKH